MKLFKLEIDHRADGANDWEEVVVRAESEDDAIASCGWTAYPRERITVAEVPPEDQDGRGIICAGIHEHEEFECLHTGCEKLSLFLCGEHSGEFISKISDWTTSLPTDLPEAGEAVVSAWDRFWKGKPEERKLEDLAGKIFDLTAVLREQQE